jgi:TetR/AcrR family transcriptional regulator, lmrAB and yxaGH operons repressor
VPRKAAESAQTKGERTRQVLVDATADLLRRQGYHATGLSQIVEESGAPRGSVYFHFPDGKDELAVAALKQSGEQWRTRIEAAVADAKDLGGAIDAIVTLLGDDLEATNFENGCPVAAVALESTARSVRTAVAAHFTALQDGIAGGLVERFRIAAPLAAQFATVALSAIEGAMLLARVHRRRDPLVTVGNALKAMAALAPT